MMFKARHSNAAVRNLFWREVQKAQSINKHRAKYVHNSVHACSRLAHIWDLLVSDYVNEESGAHHF